LTGAKHRQQGGPPIPTSEDARKVPKIPRVDSGASNFFNYLEKPEHKAKMLLEQRIKQTEKKPR